MASPNQVMTKFTLTRTSLTIGAYAYAKRMRQGQPLTLLREPMSKVNSNDVMVILTTKPDQKNHKIGYLPLGLADVIGPLMDKGVKVIARKAHTPIYGVCELAYIKPDEEPTPAPEEIAPGATGAPVAQADLDADTELPPLGDSRPTTDLSLKGK